VSRFVSETTAMMMQRSHHYCQRCVSLSCKKTSARLARNQPLHWKKDLRQFAQEVQEVPAFLHMGFIIRERNNRYYKYYYQTTERGTAAAAAAIKCSEKITK
jgi:hypothetical protein